MKKALSLILVLVLLMSLCACGGSLGTDPSDSAVSGNPATQQANESTGVAQTPTESVATEATDAPATQATEAPETKPTETPDTEPTETPATAPTTEPHIHSFSAATCTAPKTCSCGATEGEANGHSWKDATCTTPKTCSVCGITNGSASAHSYSDGTCSVCGSNDPNYRAETETTYVLNTKTKKFHRLSCGRLPTDNREDTTMIREEIIKAGYDPCGHCDP